MIKKFIIANIIGWVLWLSFLFITDNMHVHYGFMNTYLKGSNTSNIDDYVDFPFNTIKKGATIPWSTATNYNSKTIPEKHTTAFEKMNSAAYLIIKNDSIVHEQYWDDYGKTSKTNSFSMAKSIISMLIGIAIDEGKIKDVHQKVGDFIPEFKEGKKANITIEHLLTMSSGLGFEESYTNPFTFSAEGYYGRHLKETTLRHDVITEPGKVWIYLSGNTQLLTMILENIYNKNVSELTAEKLWQPIGASEDALWSLDVENGVEKGFCCFHSNARDFARFGKLFLDSGKVNGKQIISQAYIQASVSPADILDIYGNKNERYGYQWWLDPNYKGHNIYTMIGHLGQKVICIPKENMVIVHLGESFDPAPKNQKLSATTYDQIDAALEMYGN
jgi:CubicO group peptidase (beta-lactamase class C family)